MRYVIKVRVIPKRDEQERDIGKLAERLGLAWNRIGTSPVIEIPIEKGDFRIEQLQKDLRDIGTSGITFYEPVFEEWEEMKPDCSVWW